MITIDFDSAGTPSGSTNVACILNCGRIRLKARGALKHKSLVGISEENIVIEGLRYENFLVMIKNKDGTDANTKVFSAKQVILLPKSFKDWTETLKKSKGVRK
jgi:hypothetical protein